jgi:hypothetical protein
LAKGIKYLQRRLAVRRHTGLFLKDSDCRPGRFANEPVNLSGIISFFPEQLLKEELFLPVQGSGRGKVLPPVLKKPAFCQSARVLV